MTFEGEMFEGDSAYFCAEQFLLMLMGGRGGSSVPSPGSEDPHRLGLHVYELGEQGSL